MSSETRIYPRKVMQVPARIALPGGPILKARTVDLSLGGVCLVVRDPLPIGQLTMVNFEASANGQVRQFTAKAKVVYSILSGTQGFRVGLQFVQLDSANNKTLAELMI